MSRPNYTALASRSGKWWAIEVPELRGVYSQARRIDQLEYMARDAIALMLDVPPDSFDVTVQVELEYAAQAMKETFLQARAEAEKAQARAAEEARRSVRQLARQGLVTRDIGEILGISYQRVAQLLAERVSSSDPEIVVSDSATGTDAASMTDAPGVASVERVAEAVAMEHVRAETAEPVA